MMLTAYNRSTLKKAHSSATLSITSSALPDLGLSLELCGERQAKTFCEAQQSQKNIQRLHFRFKNNINVYAVNLL